MAFFDKQKLEQSKAHDSANRLRHTVMIIDDKDANLSVMTAVLRPFYHVLEARNGQEALTIIEQSGSELACIISDQRMPGLTGVELMEKAQQILPNTSRIIVSGFIDVDAVVDSINKAEIYKFIAKPFDAGDFLATVMRAVDLFELRRDAGVRYGALEQQVQAGNQELATARLALDAANAQLQALQREHASALSRIAALERRLTPPA